MIMCEMEHTNTKNLKTMQFVLHITNSFCKTLFEVIMLVIMDGSYQWILSMDLINDFMGSYNMHNRI